MVAEIFLFVLLYITHCSANAISGIYEKLAPKGLAYNTGIYTGFEVVSTVSCAHHCLMVDKCQSFDVDSSVEGVNCRLINHKVPAENLTSMPGYSYFVKGKSFCVY